ncbi:MAG TPA: hypothetical protein VFX44_02150 [Solirubrobacterales bacterium]|nr:hypothetical protein [Solirubrobacterales bacterium]
MIHLPVDHEKLARAIEERKPTWTTRAKTEMKKNRTAGKYVSKNDLWGEIKPIFVAHQFEKCAYCERRLGEAGIEWDLEHFRPKKEVKEWVPPPDEPMSTGGADENGYFLLAFDPRNYLAACKTCNTMHKGNYFPIAGQRVATAPDVASTRDERPYLLNPLDGEDPPPETLIDFFAVIPRAKEGRQEERRRAIATIKVLGLIRPDLDLGRAEKIMSMWIALGLLQSLDPDKREEAREYVEMATRADSPFASCARSFVDLYEEDPVKAREIWQEAKDFAMPNPSRQRLE